MQKYHRSIKPEIFVTVNLFSFGLSSCFEVCKRVSSDMGNDWPGGFFVRATAQLLMLLEGFMLTSAPDNLEVPRHMYLTDSKIVIGRDENGEVSKNKLLVQ